jgi:hypothetical protein
MWFRGEASSAARLFGEGGFVVVFFGSFRPTEILFRIAVSMKRKRQSKCVSQDLNTEIFLRLK